MHSFQSVLENVQRGDFLTSIDLTEAYLHVPIHQGHRQYLRFCYSGKHLQYQALQFRLASVPRVFTKLLAALETSRRSRPVRVQSFLDNILVQSERDLGITVRCLQAHGFSINVQKSHCTSMNCLLHLGVIIDTMSCQVFLSPERLESIRTLVTQGLLTKVVPLALLATLLGKMISCINIVPWARLHACPLQWFLLPF